MTEGAVTKSMMNGMGNPAGSVAEKVVEAARLESGMPEVDVESGLSLLINQSGKMRMLSHRAAMFALLAAQEADMASLFELDKAMREFCGILEAIQHGSTTLGVAENVARVLQQSQAIPGSAMDAIESFIRQARQLRRCLERQTCQSEHLADFARFVSADLLKALNTVTENIGITLQARLDHRNAQEDQTRRAVRSAIESIDHVSQKVKLISLNASIEASHAGEKGRGFSVIAAEIRALSEEAARATRGIMQQMS